MKQKPTLTPQEWIKAARIRNTDEGYVSAAGMSANAAVLGRAGMPARARNDSDAGEGARRKVPVRYD